MSASLFVSAGPSTPANVLTPINFFAPTGSVFSLYAGLPVI